MKKVLVMPALAAVLFVTACEGDPTTVRPTASVRFFNATTDMPGSGGFTTNGKFDTGSALAFGQSTPACSKVEAGTTSFGFGAVNPGGTDLSGSALSTLGNQSITADGNYTVVATGSATSPTLYLLDDDFPGTLGTGQAAVRFVNLAPGTESTANTFNLYPAAFGPGLSPFAVKIAVGAPTAYRIVTNGANTFSVGKGHNIVIPGSSFTLQAGTVNTIAIVPTVEQGGFQLINLPRCS